METRNVMLTIDGHIQLANVGDCMDDLYVRKVGALATAIGVFEYKS